MPFEIRTPAALFCFALSTAFLALPIISDSLLSAGRVYTTTADALIHLSAELLAGLPVGGLIWLPFCCTAHAANRWPRRATLIRIAALLTLSVAASLAIYFLIVFPSTFLGLFRARVWLTLILFPCAAMVIAFYASFQRLLRIHSNLLAVGLVACAWGGALIAQHQFLRLNVVLHAACLVISAIIAAMAGGIAAALLTRTARRRLFLVTAAVVLGTIVLLYVYPASNAARRAVMLRGGLAKHVTTLVIWPSADSDGDGTPSRFWGTDPDDRDQRITPLTLATRDKPPAQHGLSISPSNNPPVSLLWIVLDAVRVDTFRDILQNNERLRKVFSTFKSFDNYSSCSSRTDEVLEGLLGERRCSENGNLARQAGIARLLDRLGYESNAIGYYNKFPFKRTQKVQNEDVLRLFNELSNQLTHERPRFVLLHLRGGHAPYEDRKSHEKAIEADLQAFAAIAESDRFRDWAVVVMGDHGEAFGEHETKFHGITLYEELLRTPFLIRSNRHTPGIDSSPAGCLDMRRQVLFGLGVLPSDPGLTGFKFATLDLPAGTLGQLTPRSLRSLRTGDTKIIWEPRLDVYELYDLAKDPGELNDIADAFPERLAEAKQDLHSAVARCHADDTWISR